MSEDFLQFDHDKLNLEDFNFNVSSAIPENELLEFSSFDHHNLDSVTTTNNNFNINNHENIEHTNTNTNHTEPFHELNDHHTTSHLDPTQLINQSYDSSYFSPVASPYNSNPIHISSSFQPQSIQQSMSQSLRGRQSSISGSLSNTRNNSLYDPIESIASPSTSNRQNSSAYFSPSAKSIPLHNNKSASLQINPVASPGSFNDALSPYSSFDPSSFKSPRSIAASPIPSGSFNGSSSLPKQQLSKEDKLRRRREFHNQVERRRRDLIKEKIKELGLIVPPSLLYIDDDGKEVKASKNVIINKTVDYVVHLHKVMFEQESRREKLIAKIEELEAITGGISSSSQTPANSNTGTPQPTEQHQQQQHQQQQQQYTQSTQEFDSSHLQLHDDQNFTLSALPSIKLEDQQNLEFDVNEFLKEHNETWDHSNI